MARAARLLFPELPPELRNEVYNYLSTPETNSTASVLGLPLKLKKYECKHTTIEICPVHYGSTGLLALHTYRYEEGREYKSWLLNNAIELKIGLIFKGRINTFVQHDWDKKMEAHLRKLAKLHPWLKKVAKYDIEILWNPMDSVLKSKNNKKVAGQIPKDMIKTLTALVNNDVKKKRGDVSVKLRLAHGAAAGIELTRTRFGFAEFLSNPATDEGHFKSLSKEIWAEAYIRQPLVEPGALLLPIPLADKGEDSLLAVAKGSVRWTRNAKGKLVIGKHLVDGKESKTTVGEARGPGVRLECMVESLLGECLGWR